MAETSAQLHGKKSAFELSNLKENDVLVRNELMRGFGDNYEKIEVRIGGKNENKLNVEVRLDGRKVNGASAEIVEHRGKECLEIYDKDKKIIARIYDGDKVAVKNGEKAQPKIEDTPSIETGTNAISHVVQPKENIAPAVPEKVAEEKAGAVQEPEKTEELEKKHASEEHEKPFEQKSEMSALSEDKKIRFFSGREIMVGDEELKSLFGDQHERFNEWLNEKKQLVKDRSDVFSSGKKEMWEMENQEIYRSTNYKTIELDGHKYTVVFSVSDWDGSLQMRLVGGTKPMDRLLEKGVNPNKFSMEHGHPFRMDEFAKQKLGAINYNLPMEEVNRQLKEAGVVRIQAKNGNERGGRRFLHEKGIFGRIRIADEIRAERSERGLS